jgi:hypothetical protein
MIFNPFSPPPVNTKSHVRGWSMHWAECLQTIIASKSDDLSTAKALYFDHGVNFGGGLNLFGGVTDEVVDRIEQVVAFDGELFSLDIPMPDYADQLSKRIGQATCSERLTPALLSAFKDTLTESKPLFQSQLGLKCAAIGDSHSTAFAQAGSAVLRTNGLTLFGALTRGDFAKQLSTFKKIPKQVTLVAGSIDVRHHIGRTNNPIKSIEDLCENYSNMVRFLESEFAISIEVASPVPVEYEDRKLPKTGYYKDAAFFGNIVQRQDWTNHFMEMISCENKMITPPKSWYQMDPEQYAKENMELSSSVHIAPSKYRRFNWGQI